MITTKTARLCLLATLVAPGLARADAAVPQAQSLATVEAIMDYCAKIMPAAAEHLHAQARLLTQGSDEETLAKVRESEEYRASHDLALENLAKVEEQDARKACAQNLSQLH